MYALISKVLPATRYFVSFSGAYNHAKALGLSKRSYKIKEPANQKTIDSEHK